MRAPNHQLNRRNFPHRPDIEGMLRAPERYAYYIGPPSK